MSSRSKTLTPQELQALRTRLAWMEWLLERAVPLPFIKKKVGADALLGFVPVVGDLTMAAVALYLVYEGARVGMPKRKLLRMLTRIGLDTTVGSLPFIGDIWDFFYASSSRNLADIKMHLDAVGVSRAAISAAHDPAPVLEGVLLAKQHHPKK